MNSTILIIHKYTMWLVLISILLIFIFSVSGLVLRSTWSIRLHKLIRSSVILMDIQFLIGIIIYFFFSPIVKSGLSNFGGGMKNPEVRFFLVEHGTMMFIALALAHIGKVRVNKSAARYKTAVIFFGLTLLLILLGIPWKRVF